MTEPDFEAAKLRVYEEFGIWKPGEFQCMYHLPCHGDRSGEHQGFRRIPPPELTDAVAWRIYVAALPKVFSIQMRKWGVKLENTEVLTTGGHASDPDPKRALIEALAGAGQGAHEA